MLGRSACTSRSAANFCYPRSPYAAAKLYAHWVTRSTVSRSADTSHWLRPDGARSWNRLCRDDPQHKHASAPSSAALGRAPRRPKRIEQPSEDPRQRTERENEAEADRKK